MSIPTTTSSFQKLPDFYKSKEECEEYHEKKKEVTNPRYPHFTQMYFTAGDVEQFNTYRDSTNGTNPNPIIDMSDNVWYEFSKHIKTDYPKFIKDIVENTDWEKYRNLTTESVDNTFHYIFDKFKKGIFVKIKNNQLSVFLPFSKNDYINEWSDYIGYDSSKFRDIVDFIQFANKQCGYDVPRERINKFVDRWYGNNCLIRPEFPVGENDRGLANVKDMFVELCKNRIVPDIELFINKRDFPIITKSEFEPYEQIYGVETFPLLSHKYSSYSPILSMVTTNKHSDIPFPTHEDWARVSSQEDNKFFAPDCRDYRYNFSKEWSERKPIAVFRGASTGCGVTIETNPRLKIAYLSSVSPVEHGNPLLDAGITKWNLRPRKIMSSPVLQMIDPKTMPFWNSKTNGLVKPLTPEEQASYKYIVNVDGHVNAFRLSLEMSMGCVILMVESKYRIWFRRYLKEYVHYVPIKADLSDIFEKIRWCREHDKECEQIALNAKKFYDTYLTKNGILDYLQYMMFSIKKSTGTYFYNTVKIDDIIKDMEKEIIEKEFKENKDIDDIKDIKDISFPFYERDYYAREGLGILLRKLSFSDSANLSDVSNIHESKDTLTQKKTLTKNLSILLKNLKNKSRSSQLVNEGFCGLTEINKLCKELPHFRYTYSYDNDNEILLTEYLDGMTLKDYMLNEKFTMKKMLNIFTMLTLALAVAQERCGFVHYDLYPWNIIILNTKKQRIVYQVNELIFEIETDIIPVMIDYGRSHIIKDGVHYGNCSVDPFKTSRYQDIFCMVVSCIYEFTQIPKNFIIPTDLKKLLEMLNFFIGDTSFHSKKLENYQEMMGFLVKHKKYNEMIFGNKCYLEKKLPIDFFMLLADLNEDTDMDITQYQYPEKAPYRRVESNPYFYYLFISGKDPNQYIFDYLGNIEMRYEDIMSDAVNILVYLNICNEFALHIYGVYEFLKFMKEKGIYDTPSLNQNMFICDRLMTRINMKFMIHEKSKSRDLELDYFTIKESFVLAKYTPKTFSTPQKILTLIQSYLKEYDTYLIDVQEMFIKNFFYKMPYSIDEEDEIEITKKNSDLLKLSRLVTINDMANLNTLKLLSSKIYPQEKRVFENVNNPPLLLLRVIDDLINVSI